MQASQLFRQQFLFSLAFVLSIVFTIVSTYNFFSNQQVKQQMNLLLLFTFVSAVTTSVFAKPQTFFCLFTQVNWTHVFKRSELKSSRLSFQIATDNYQFAFIFAQCFALLETIPHTNVVRLFCLVFNSCCEWRNTVPIRCHVIQYFSRKPNSVARLMCFVFVYRQSHLVTVSSAASAWHVSSHQ